MSVLKEIKGIVLRGLKSETEEVKKATIEVFEAIDADLDSVDYDPANSNEDSALNVLESIATLNNALIELTEEEDTPATLTVGDVADKDLLEDDDQN